ncbi:hypothetical protein MKX03_031804 [Papaver bracteatum]|nr:hypothetical protein MKX03_031804 [Papaver bracteatum]
MYTPFAPVLDTLLRRSRTPKKWILRKTYETCSYRTAPIIFIDEIDAIASKRGNLQRDMEQRIVTQLLTCMDEPYQFLGTSAKNSGSARSGKQHGYVLVVGARNRPGALDPALRRPGRFDREIAWGLSKDCNFDLAKIAKTTPGFVGTDLSALATEAGNRAMKRISYSRKPDTEEANVNWWSRRLEPGERKDLDIRMSDFEPSLRREGFSAIPNVKKEFNDYIVSRIKYPEEYEVLSKDFCFMAHQVGVKLIAKAVANEAGVNFIHIKVPELLNKYVGESELAIRTIFSHARTCSPCILFFDEVETITTKRGNDGGRVVERLLTQLLIELDGGDKRKGVFVIGATNRPEVMDEAIKRPGRLGKHMCAPLPGPEERGLILKALTKDKPVSEEVDLVAIGLKESYENLSGADLARVVDKAAMIALLEKRISQMSVEVGSEMRKWTINQTHFDQAVETLSPSVTDEQRGFEKMGTP